MVLGRVSMSNSSGQQERTDKCCDGSAQEAVIMSSQSRQAIRNCFGAKICAHVAGLPLVPYSYVVCPKLQSISSTMPYATC